jgi:hypothetical protein
VSGKGLKVVVGFTIGGQAIIRFYNAAIDEEKLTAVAALSEILRQIDEGRKGFYGFGCCVLLMKW